MSGGVPPAATDANSAALIVPPSTEAKADDNPLLTVPVEDPTKQWWYRAPDSKVRKTAEKIFIMRAAGRDDTQIAKKLDSTPASVRQMVYIARKNGWVDDGDEPIDLELDLALTVDRKIVRNISAALDGQMTNYQTHEMTIAAAKGRGVFKNHEKSEVTGAAAMTAVAIQIIMPPVGAEDQQIGGVDIPDNMVGGVPAYLEGEVSDGGSATTTE